MATSGSVSFTTTTDNIITYAVKYIGKLGEGDSLTSEEYNDCLFFLNSMVKQWIAKNDYAPGLKMWLRKRGFLFLNNSTGIYTVGSFGNSAASYWTNTFGLTSSGCTNAQGATTVKLATTSALPLNMQPNTAGSTLQLVPNMYVGIELDSGALFWTKIATVPTSTTITIASPGLPSSSNNIGNVVYAFSTIATPPQVIENIVLRDNDANDTPVQLLTLDQYMQLPSKQSPGYLGDPIAAYYEPHLVGGNGYGYGLLYTDFAGAQDVSKYFCISYVSEIEDFVNPSDEMCFPKEWGMALIKGLARHIAPMFNATWTQAMEESAIGAIRLARNANNKKTDVGFAVGDRGGMAQV